MALRAVSIDIPSRSGGSSTRSSCPLKPTGALSRGPLFARLDAGEARFLAVFALVGDRALVRRLGGDGGFLEALRERAYRTFARTWTRPLAVEVPGDASGGGSVVAVSLPLLGVSRDDPQAYGTYLQGMLDASARVAFVTMNEAYARTFPEGSALRAVCPDFGPRGDVLHLQLYCRPALQYECTRAALLGSSCTGASPRLAAAGGTDGRLLSVDAWAVGEHPELKSYVAPSSAEECLWAFAGLRRRAVARSPCRFRTRRCARPHRAPRGACARAHRAGPVVVAGGRRPAGAASRVGRDRPVHGPALLRLVRGHRQHRGVRPVG